MKKLLGIVVLGLSLSVNAYANDIKILNISCNELGEKKLFNTHHFFISKNQKKAKYIHYNDESIYIDEESYNVKPSVISITFSKGSSLDPQFIIHRKSAKLLQVWDTISNANFFKCIKNDFADYKKLKDEFVNFKNELIKQKKKDQKI